MNQQANFKLQIDMVLFNPYATWLSSCMGSKAVIMSTDTFQGALDLTSNIIWAGKSCKFPISRLALHVYVALNWRLSEFYLFLMYIAYFGCLCRPLTSIGNKSGLWWSCTHSNTQCFFGMQRVSSNFSWPEIKKGLSCIHCLRLRRGASVVSVSASVSVILPGDLIHLLWRLKGIFRAGQNSDGICISDRHLMFCSALGISWDSIVVLLVSSLSQVTLLVQNARKLYWIPLKIFRLSSCLVYVVLIHTELSNVFEPS